MEEKVILLVEDNPDDVALTLRAFKKSNLENRVIVVQDGVEALDYLLCTGTFSNCQDCPLPEVILLDLKLPKIDGLEVLQRLRAEERTRLLPVIILTSSSEQEDIVNSYSFGANSYIRKPVDFTQFMDAVLQLGLYWLVLNELPKKE